jgi:hypothetical protein
MRFLLTEDRCPKTRLLPEELHAVNVGVAMAAKGLFIDPYRHDRALSQAWDRGVSYYFLLHQSPPPAEVDPDSQANQPHVYTEK